MKDSTRYRKAKEGQYVRLRDQLVTKGGTILGQGLVMRIDRKHNGLHLRTIEAEPCSHCNTAQRKYVLAAIQDVDLMPEGWKPEDLQPAADGFDLLQMFARGKISFAFKIDPIIAADEEAAKDQARKILSEILKERPGLQITPMECDLRIWENTL